MVRCRVTQGPTRSGSLHLSIPVWMATKAVPVTMRVRHYPTGGRGAGVRLDLVIPDIWLQLVR